MYSRSDRRRSRGVGTKARPANPMPCLINRPSVQCHAVSGCGVGGSYFMKSGAGVPKGKSHRGTSNGPPASATSAFILDPSPHSLPHSSLHLNHKGTGENTIQKKFLNDMIRKYEQDMVTLNTRLSDLQGVQHQHQHQQQQSEPGNSSSFFVHSLRNSIDTSRQFHGSIGQDSTSQQQGQYEMTVTKYEILDQLLKKINELNRVILTKTDLTTVLSTGGGKVRRASRGSDLFHFPTHLLLIDRLIDLHAISQRSVLIRNTSQEGVVEEEEESRNSTAEREKVEKEMELMRQRYEKEMKVLTSQLTESQTTCQELQSHLNKSSQEIEELKSDIRTLAIKKSPRSPRHTMPPSTGLQVIGTSSTETSTGSSITSTNPAPAGNLMKKLEAEIMELKCRLEVSEQKNQKYEEKIEFNASMTQQIITALLKLKKMSGEISSGEATAATATGSLLESSRHQSMTEELKRPLEDLYQSLRSILDTRSTSLNQLEEEKKALVSEITSLQEKEMQSKKYYDENTQHLLEQQTKREAEYKKMCELCQEYKVELEEGRRQCLEMRGQLGTMGRLTERIEQLQREILDSDDRRYALDRTLSEAQTEITSLRSLNDNLMRKLKKLTAQDSSRDFAETFEEVMREEMMAMKTAFEAKLKLAVEERDIATRRHQTELLKLQSKVHVLEECR